MRTLSFLFAFAALTVMGQPAPQQSQAPGSLAPYLPTPDSVVDRMLQAGKLEPGETMFDLGSGDGRIVIAAAKKYKANAIGVELDDALVAKSKAKIYELGLDQTARIIRGDLLQQDYSSADLVTVYLWPQSNAKVARLLEQQLKKGARVVAHDFPLGNWTPAATITIPDDGTGRSHTLYVYIR
ncbi:MAG TPA: class I SAM-dependent methyltransferase [Bryobacteraceae bacterium]|nr:class I SAM-dependent methyltransferase [Bryobacteraceae bacterium]